MLSWSEAGILFAIIASGIASARAILETITKWRSDKIAVDEARAKRPEIHKQLEVGNISGAVETISTITVRQEAYINRLELRIARLEEREAELERENESLHLEVRELRTKVAKYETNRVEGNPHDHT